METRSSTDTSNSIPTSSHSSQHFESAPSTHSNRRQSVLNTIPSYMNYQNGAAAAKRKSVPVRHIPSTAASSVNEATPIGMLVVIIAGEPFATILSYIEAFLKKNALASIALIGDLLYERQLKELKMDIYATIGRLKLQASVFMYLADGWKEATIHTTIQEAIQHGSAIEAVLVIPQDSKQSRALPEILDLNQDDLESALQTSLIFLHAVAKSVIPKLHARDSRRRHFLLIEDDLLSPIGLTAKVACGTLLKQLMKAHASPDLIIDYAEECLAPTLRKTESLKIDIPQVPASNAVNGELDDFVSGESPTKLWNMWALQDEIIGVN